MNCLTVDAGNSQLAMVLYQNGEKTSTLRIRTHPHPSVEEMVDSWNQVLSSRELTSLDVELSISSVVPQLQEALREAASQFSPRSFHWVSWESPHKFGAPESAQREIGADLIAGLVGAREVKTGPLVVIDCGTATTLTLVDSDNFVMGVAILPGLVTQLLSLTRSAPHLPQDVSLRPPQDPFGTDTEQALQSGILYGHSASIEGLIGRYQDYFPQEALVAVGCGGLYHRISSLCPSVEFEQAELVNLGCRILAERQLQEGL